MKVFTFRYEKSPKKSLVRLYLDSLHHHLKSIYLLKAIAGSESIGELLVYSSL